jgi:hypothetical protein
MNSCAKVGTLLLVELDGLDGRLLVHKSWSVAYQDSQPNGDGCNPTCRAPVTMTEL